jgi:hypothetical protein
MQSPHRTRQRTDCWISLLCTRWAGGLQAFSRTSPTGERRCHPDAARQDRRNQGVPDGRRWTGLDADCGGATALFVPYSGERMLRDTIADPVNEIREHKMVGIVGRATERRPCGRNAVPERQEDLFRSGPKTERRLRACTAHGHQDKPNACQRGQQFIPRRAAPPGQNDPNQFEQYLPEERNGFGNPIHVFVLPKRAAKYVSRPSTATLGFGPGSKQGNTFHRAAVRTIIHNVLFRKDLR